ncbi:MAG: hypothetical protein WB697_07360 [Stellaceae bacterium]
MLGIRRGTGSRVNRVAKPGIAAVVFVKEIAGAAAAKRYNGLPSGGVTSVTFTGSTIVMVGARCDSACGAVGRLPSGSSLKSTH